MGRLLRVGVAFLLAFLAASQLSFCHGVEAPVREGRTEPAPAISFVKGWSDWAQSKLSSYGKKSGDAPLQACPGEDSAAAAISWSDWATQKIYSFSGGASQSAGKAAQAGKEKIKSGGEAAAKTGQEKWEAAKAGARHGSAKGSEYADKAYETAKDVGNKATEKLKQQEDEL